VGPLGGVGTCDLGAPTINVRNINGAPPREVLKLKIRVRPLSTLRNIDSGAPGGVGVEDLGERTINAKKHRWWAPGRCQSWRFGSAHQQR
jgi:hypothetical protein